MQEPSERSPRWTIIVPAIAVVIFMTLLLAYGLVAAHYIPDWPTRAQFGESFGGIVAFFQAITLGAIVWTLYLQVQDASSQKRRQALFELQLAALRDSSKAQALTGLLRVLREQIDQTPPERRKTSVFTDLQERASSFEDQLEEIITKLSQTSEEVHYEDASTHREGSGLDEKYLVAYQRQSNT